MFCEKCLLGISNGEQGWHCPECRNFHNCAINTLARNYHLEKLVEKFKKLNDIKLEHPSEGQNPSSSLFPSLVTKGFSPRTFRKFYLKRLRFQLILKRCCQNNWWNFQWSKQPLWDWHFFLANKWSNSRRSRSDESTNTGPTNTGPTNTGPTSTEPINTCWGSYTRISWGKLRRYEWRTGNRSFRIFLMRDVFSGKNVQDSCSDRKSDRDTFDQRWSGRYNFAGVMDGKSYFKEILPNSIRIKTRCFNNFNN